MALANINGASNRTKNNVRSFVSASLEKFPALAAILRVGIIRPFSS